jgi:hypothetical protein
MVTSFMVIINTYDVTKYNIAYTNLDFLFGFDQIENKYIF